MSTNRQQSNSIYSKRVPNTGSRSIHCESYKNGDFYLGTKVHNLWSGTGLLISGRGGVYEGGFSGSHYHGSGYLTLPDGRTYAGQFVKGGRDGYGKLTEPGKSDYIGEFKNGKRFGIGILKDESGRVVKGTFVDGVLHGFGFVDVRHSQYQFKGKFNEGVYDGVGQENHGDSKYLGHFSVGKKDGIGYMKIGDKARFLGYWSQDIRNGFGIEHFENGDMYEGDFKENERTGIGRYMYKKSGYSYIGEFSDGKRHGFGRLEGENLLYIGNWHQNKREGIGYQRLTDGRAYFGYWKNDLRHGLGYEFGNDVEYKGNWRFDKPDGIGIVKVGENVSDPALFKEGALEEKVEVDVSGFMKKIHMLDLSVYFGEAEPKILHFENYVHTNRGMLIQRYKKIEYDSGKVEKIVNNKLKKVFSTMDQVFEEITYSRKVLTQFCEELSPDQLYDLQSAIRRSENWLIPKGGRKMNFNHYLQNIGYREKETVVRDFERMRGLGDNRIKSGDKESMFNELILESQDTFGNVKSFEERSFSPKKEDVGNEGNIPSTSRFRVQRDKLKRQKSKELDNFPDEGVEGFNPFKGRSISREDIFEGNTLPGGEYKINDDLVDKDRENELRIKKRQLEAEKAALERSIASRSKSRNKSKRRPKSKSINKNPKSLNKDKSKSRKRNKKNLPQNQFSNTNSFLTNLKSSNIDPKNPKSIYNTDSEEKSIISKYSETPSMKFGMEISDKMAVGLSGERPLQNSIDREFMKSKPEGILLQGKKS